MDNQKDGILIGSDREFEWMLEWWWDHYSTHNTYPVTFIDFGMSQSAWEWCKQHGQVISFDTEFDFITPKEEIEPRLRALWESMILTKKLWEIRVKWFKKPFAMAQSPYQRTIWLDLDCEVKANLGPLFETCENATGFAIAPEPEFSQERWLQQGLLQPGERNYNAGVVVFKENSAVFPKWTNVIREKNRFFVGDSDLLAHIVNSERFSICELPQIYNWRMAQGPNPDAVIIHWVSDWGKNHIRSTMKK